MITTFKQKLIVAFSGLCALILIQSAVAYVLIQRAQFFEKRSLTAQEILVAYTNIGADKQRLKVWYAELLLTGKASAQVRDALIDRINDNIQKVHLRLPLQVRDTIFGSQGATAQARYLDDTKVLNTIEQNFANFRSKVSQSEFAQADIDKQQVWGEMLSTFDVSGGQDVRVLIANAIDQQLSISAQANGQANTAIELSNTMRLMALLVTIVSAIGMTWYFVKHLTQPIADLMLGTQQIQAATSSSALPVVVPYRSSDEFGSLAVSFNSMAHEIHLRRISDQNQKQQLESAVSERTTQLVKANEVLKLDEIRRRQLFSDLGHELRTPATVILGEAEIALRGSDKSIQDYQLSLSNIATTTRQLTQRINGLLLIARGHFQADELDFAEQNIYSIVEAAIAQARALAHSASIEVLPCQLFSEHETAGSKLEIRTDADKLHQLLMVFYDNAIRYTPAGGCVTTTITSSPQQLMVSIDDTGIGIGKDERKELFLRHFRGVQARQMRSDGAGLGLAIAKTLAEALGIEIAIESTGRRGCRVNLCHRGK